MPVNQLTDDIFRKIAPTVPKARREEFLKWLNIYLPMYGITNERRIAALFANLMHESGNFSKMVENLNYSAGRLMQVFGKRFPTLEKAKQYAGQPEKLANYVYGNRRDLGNVNPGDGWKYRGRSPMQTTGRANYERVQRVTKLPVVDNPQLLERIDVGVHAACIFFKENGCNQLADARRFRDVCIRINGGTNGMSDRIANYERVLRWLPDDIALVSPKDWAKTADTVPQFAGLPKGSNGSDEDMIELPDNELPDYVTGEQIADDDEVERLALEVLEAPQIRKSDADIGHAPENALTGLQTPNSGIGATAPDPNQAVESTTTAATTTGAATVSKEVTVKNEQDVNQTAKVEAPAPYNQIGFWATIKRDVAALFGGNVSIDVATEYAGKANALGFSPDFWKRIFYFVLIASACYLLFRLIHYIVDAWKQNQRVKLQAEVNSDITRKDIEFVQPERTA